MGPNAWLWFLPLKTALGDGINFPTRIPLAECSTFHSIGELCFDTFPVKMDNCEQASLCQVGQRLQVGPWSTRCLGRKGSLSSPPCRAPQAAPLTASWTSPRTRRWSRTRSTPGQWCCRNRGHPARKSHNQSLIMRFGTVRSWGDVDFDPNNGLT